MYQNKYTTKLFYKKYAYRLSVRCLVASIFRNKDFNYAKYRIDSWNQDVSKGISPRLGHRSDSLLPISDLHFALRLLNIFTTTSTDYTLRIEGRTLNVFSNDTVWLSDLKNKLGVNVIEFTQPANDQTAEFLLKNPNYEVVKSNVQYKYKIKTRFCKGDYKSFGEWCKSFSKHVRISGLFLEELLNSSSIYEGRLVYVKDEKTLNIVTMFIGEAIQSITHLVTVEDLDI